jgi:RNA polymerase sigma factor (sigma-70 family)
LLEQIAFRDMMDLVRLGDQEAAAELVRHFGPKIRKAIRKPLIKHCLSRELDAHDISQTVLAHFFLNNLAARFRELDHPDELSRLLVVMAQNKLRDHLRKLHANRRDRRRMETGQWDCLRDIVARRDVSPGKIVARQEIIQELYRRLKKEERELAEQRFLGLDWATIAANQGGSAEALRKKLTRALGRVGHQLGIANLF